MNGTDDWGWLNHGRYMHACETFPMKVNPIFGEPYTQQAIVAAGIFVIVLITFVCLSTTIFLLWFKFDNYTTI